ncbi:protein TsetseEP-like [Eupeodes corollae]|uniref:protein TsetseEP-like n=1 Tax=Eupeodes corollae TaxID=290404 RepID=UPI00248F582B|nr:protein TsetseEP-like [Eupeodes corollae]
MKSINWLFLTLSVFVIYSRKTSAHNKSVHVDCYNVFIPLIERVSSDAKKASANCVSIANTEKDRELVAINNTRSELFTEVKRIKETLAHCSSRSDHLGYFECLNGIIEVDKKIVGDITLKSSLYSNKINKIEKQELDCFRNSVIKLKDKISTGIKNLHNCLLSEEDASPMESGERSRHSEMHHSSIHQQSSSVHLTSNDPQTTPYPEYRYDDYDINNY